MFVVKRPSSMSRFDVFRKTRQSHLVKTLDTIPPIFFGPSLCIQVIASAKGTEETFRTPKRSHTMYSSRFPCKDCATYIIETREYSGQVVRAKVSGGETAKNEDLGRALQSVFPMCLSVLL